MNRTCIVLAVLFLGGLAFGQDSGSGSKDFSLKLSGDHQFAYRLPVGDQSWDTGYSGEAKNPRFRNEFGLEVHEGPLALVSQWQLDTFLAETQSVTDQWSGSTRVRPLENYIAWNPDTVKLAFGYQIYAWGVADGRNPTDNINPRDYTTFEGSKSHKIPVLSASLNWYPSDEVSVETVWVPQATNNISPVDYQTKLTAYGLNTGYSHRGTDPKEFVAGGKLNYRTPEADLSVSYVYDIDAMYTPVVSDDLSSITLERRRIHRFGADAKTTIDRFGLWAEGAYSFTGNTDTSDYSQRLSRWDYTVGFDFNYGPQDAYYVNFQYTGTVVPGYDTGSNRFSPTDKRFIQKNLVATLGGEREAVVQGLTWNAHWNLANDTVVPTLTGSYSMPFGYDDSVTTRYGNLLLKPEIDVMPVDSFHITVGAILTYAWVKDAGKDVRLDTSQDSLGIYTPSNAVFVAVTYKWNYETSK